MEIKKSLTDISEFLNKAILHQIDMDEKYLFVSLFVRKTSKQIIGIF